LKFDRAYTRAHRALPVAAGRGQTGRSGHTNNSSARLGKNIVISLTYRDSGSSV
jgi:hypothetical protein